MGSAIVVNWTSRLIIVAALSPILVHSFFFSSRRRHTRCGRDWSSDVCSSDLHDTLHFDRRGDGQISREDLSGIDRKSTRLNSSHVRISYAVFCLKKTKTKHGLRH